MAVGVPPSDDLFHRLIALADAAADEGSHGLAAELVDLAYEVWDAAQSEEKIITFGLRRALLSAVVLTGIAACSAGLAITSRASLFDKHHWYPSLVSQSLSTHRFFAKPSRLLGSGPGATGHRFSYVPSKMSFDPPLPSTGPS